MSILWAGESTVVGPELEAAPVIGKSTVVGYPSLTLGGCSELIQLLENENDSPSLLWSWVTFILVAFNNDCPSLVSVHGRSIKLPSSRPWNSNVSVRRRWKGSVCPSSISVDRDIEISRILPRPRPNLIATDSPYQSLKPRTIYVSWPEPRNNVSVWTVS